MDQQSGKQDGENHSIRPAKRKKKNEDSLRELCNNIKYSNIYFIEVSKGKESEMGTETLFEEIMAENLINLINKTDIQD